MSSRSSASSSRQSLVLSSPSTRPRTPSLERVSSSSNGPKITRQSSIHLTDPTTSHQRAPSPSTFSTRPPSTSTSIPLSSFTTAPPLSPVRGNGPIITRVQSVMGEPPVLGRPNSPPLSNQSHPLEPRSTSMRTRQRSQSSDRSNTNSNSEGEEIIRVGETRRSSNSSLNKGRVIQGQHMRDQTSESTTADSFRTQATQWNGGFTPKASQDPLISQREIPSLPSPPPQPIPSSSFSPSYSQPPEEKPFQSYHASLTPHPDAATQPIQSQSQSQFHSIPISHPFIQIPITPIIDPKSSRPLKRHKLHQGRNRFLFGGRLVTSKDNPLPFIGSLGVALLLPGLWFAFVGSGLWEDSEAFGGNGGGKGVVIVFAYLTLIMWSSMLKASLSDPGILPRNLDPTPQRKYVENEDALTTGGEKGMTGGGQFVAETKYLRVRDGVVGSKWCETCEIYRPPRTSHCRLCDNCVELTDHHCAFLNNCIGRRNYFPFLSFLLSSNLLLLYSISFTAYYISLTPSHPSRWSSIGSYILLALLVGMMVPVGGLGLYHARLVWKNRTTIEMLRPKSARGGLNPSNGETISNLFELSSPRKNCMAIVCRPGLGVGGRGRWREVVGRDARKGGDAEEEEEARAGRGKERV
ncbi:hypothetical protein JCM5353_001017 [Sporobolomyces roseus]